jgi:DNA-binding MarR family transcriptional regulator
MEVQSTERRRLTLLVKAAELTQRIATGPILEKHGLTYAQLAMLLSVGGAPGRSGAQLARMHGITAQSAGEVISALVRRGLLERRQSASNARIFFIHLSSIGEALRDDAWGQLDEIDHRLTKGLSVAELEIARRVLDVIVLNGGNSDLFNVTAEPVGTEPVGAE